MRHVIVRSKRRTVLRETTRCLHFQQTTKVNLLLLSLREDIQVLPMLALQGASEIGGIMTFARNTVRERLNGIDQSIVCT